MDCVQLAHFSLGYWKDISIAHVIIIIKSESTLPTIIFFRGCVLEMFATSYSVTFRENRDFVFTIIVQFMMSSNSRIRFGLLIVFVCLYITSSHYHNCANLSEDIELIKCLSDIYLSSVRVGLSIFSQLSNIHIWGCVFSVYPSPLWWFGEYKLCLIIIIKSEVWTITNCFGLGHETMEWSVCLSIFLSHTVYCWELPITCHLVTSYINSSLISNWTF